MPSPSLANGGDCDGAGSWCKNSAKSPWCGDPDWDVIEIALSPLTIIVYGAILHELNLKMNELYFSSTCTKALIIILLRCVTISLCSVISGNSDLSCQPKVDERCATGQVRLATDRSCVDTSYDCTDTCGSFGGSLNVDLGKCVCASTPVPQEYECSHGCTTVSV